MGMNNVALVVAVLACSLLGCDALKKKALSEALGDADIPGAVTPAEVQTSTIKCVGRQTLSFTKQKFDVTSGPAIQAAGHCAVTCTDCTIKAPDGISIGGGATFTMTGGSIEGSNKAIRTGGTAKLTFSGTKVTGRIERAGSATISGLPNFTDDGVAEKLGKGACTGMIDCYKKFNQTGEISGKVTATIGANGHATGATYEGGNASKEVQHCMTELAKTKTVSGATKAGSLVCEYSGSISGGDEELDYGETFH